MSSYIIITILSLLLIYSTIIILKKKDELQSKNYWHNSLLYSNNMTIIKDSYYNNVLVVKHLLKPYFDILKDGTLEKDNLFFIKETLKDLDKLVIKFDIENTIEYRSSEKLGLLEYKYLSGYRIIGILDNIIKINPKTNEERKALFSINNLADTDNYRKEIFQKTKDMIAYHYENNKEEKLMLIYTEPELKKEAENIFNTKDVFIVNDVDDISLSGATSCFYI